MKKRLTKSVIALLLAVSLTGCASSSRGAMEALEERVEKEDSGENRKNRETEKTTETEVTEETSAGRSAGRSKGNNGEVTVGDECAGYDGFSTLQEREMEMKLEDGNVLTLTVFIPDSEWIYGEGESLDVKSENGVSLTLFLEDPSYYLQDAEPEELLEEERKETYSPYNLYDKENVSISDIISEGDTAWYWADYIKYNRYDETFTSCRSYHLIKNMDKARLNCELTVSLLDVTEDTPVILEELSSFYGFENDWNAGEMRQFLTDYTDRPEVWESYSAIPTAGMVFEMPRNWYEDWEYENKALGEYSYIYAPDGDVSSADGYMEFYTESVGYETDEAAFAEILKDPDSWEDLLVEGALKDQTDITRTTLQTDCLGEVAVIESRTDFEGREAVSRIYMGYKENYLFMIRLVQAEDAREDAQVWIDDFLKNGSVRGSDY